jgi:hypothetical protein
MKVQNHCYGGYSMVILLKKQEHLALALAISSP